MRPIATLALVALVAPCLVCADEGSTPAAPPPAAPAAPPAAPAFHGAQSPIPDAIALAMKKHSWREGCPVPIDGLSYLTVTHWGFDGATHPGELVVDATLAAEVLEIFGELFAAEFPIEKMRLIDAYDGSDDRSMADNNTSAFNCRWVAGRRGVFSKHSHGRAIDINPLINPYVTKKSIEPPGGDRYADRSRPATGIILSGDTVVRAFKSRGWSWGGDWRRVKDYQHFEKRLAPKK